MHIKLFQISVLLILQVAISSGQVKLRLFTELDAESVIFSVTAGKYEIISPAGTTAILEKGEPAIIFISGEKLIVKARNIYGFISDSVFFLGVTGKDSFSLRVNTSTPVRQNYTGDLQCRPDLGTLLLINTSDIDAYIAGVVKAEGGPGKNPEYIRTQAIIARTYMYRYFDKHISDGYNLCDNTHCQAFNGVTSDSSINSAAISTEGLVILGPDSTLVISAFHSNCGGETSPSEDVWLTGQPYLKKVRDIHCLSSHNARWQKSFSISDWISYLKKSGLSGDPENVSLLNYSQLTRLNEYRVDTFSVPLRQMRTDLSLRSTWFSVMVEGDSVILNGKGYGHGIGLCQEGAMSMADKGSDFKQIIDFYYTGVIISDIRNAVVMSKNPNPN